jgi:hypothetical protein
MTAWITLAEARKLVTEEVLAPSLAEQLIIERLRRGGMTWRSLYREGYRKVYGVEVSEPDYLWRQYDESPHDGDGAIQRIQVLRIYWDESRVVRRHGLIATTLYRVEVLRADVLAMLRTERRKPPGPEPEISEEQLAGCIKWLIKEPGVCKPRLLDNKEDVICEKLNDKLGVKRSKTFWREKVIVPARES